MTRYFANDEERLEHHFSQWFYYDDPEDGDLYLSLALKLEDKNYDPLRFKDDEPF